MALSFMDTCDNLHYPPLLVYLWKELVLISPETIFKVSGISFVGGNQLKIPFRLTYPIT